MSAAGSLAYLSGGTAGEEQLIWVARDGHAEPVGPANCEITQVALAADGKRLLTTEQGSAANGYQIWVHDLTNTIETRLTFEI